MFSRSAARLSTVVSRRFLSQAISSSSRRGRSFNYVAGFVGATAVTSFLAFAESAKDGDFPAIKAALVKLLEENEDMGPTLVRLAWHSSGTYDKNDGSGGSSGARMRFAPESEWGANAGLGVARNFLEGLKKQYPSVSYSDLWIYASYVAIEYMGGPSIDFKTGRRDLDTSSGVLTDGRLPDASKQHQAGVQHYRDVYHRMGLNDQEIVALLGAHSIGRCHKEASGFDGPWTRAPTTFSNLFFKELTTNTWTPKQWNGPFQYTDPSGDLMMLPTDMALLEDPVFKKWVDVYAKDEAQFFKDFASAYKKLTELGFASSGKKGWFFG